MGTKLFLGKNIFFPNSIRVIQVNKELLQPQVGQVEITFYSLDDIINDKVRRFQVT